MMGKRKAAEVENTELPAERKRRKRAADGNSTIDLNYPFWYTIEQPEINPPLLNPTGPLYQEDDMLSLRMTKPIALVRGGVGLKTNDTLGVDDDGNLSLKIAPGSGIGLLPDNGLTALVDGVTIKFNSSGRMTATASSGAVVVDPEGPLVNSEEGLNIRLNATMELDHDWDLGVKLDPKGCVDYGPDGINVNVDDTLLIEAGDTGQSYELGVHLNPNGPITADADGIDLEIDQQTLEVSTTSGQGVLGVKTNPSGPLVKTSAGITLGINTNSSFLSVSGAGLGLKYNSQDFLVSQDTLCAFTPIRYLSPYCYCTVGNPDMKTSNAVFKSGGTQISGTGAPDWQGIIYAQLANSSGIVNCILNLGINQADNSGKLGNPPQTTKDVWFTVILNLSDDADGDHSKITGWDCKPLASGKKYFLPGPSVMSASYVPIVVTDGDNWYAGGDHNKGFGQRVDFFPIGNGITFTEGQAYYYCGKLQSKETLGLVVVTVQVKTTVSFYNGSTGTLTTGPIALQWQGTVPDFSAGSA